MRVFVIYLIVLPVALSASLCGADVFNMPAGQTSLLTVPVGDAGNAGNYAARLPTTTRSANTT